MHKDKGKFTFDFTDIHSPIFKSLGLSILKGSPLFPVRGLIHLLTFAISVATTHAYGTCLSRRNLVSLSSVIGTDGVTMVNSISWFVSLRNCFSPLSLMTLWSLIWLHFLLNIPLLTNARTPISVSLTIGTATRECGNKTNIQVVVCLR